MLSWLTILTYLLALTLEKDTFSGFEWSDWSRQQERDAKSNLPLLTDPLKNGTPKNLEVSLDIQPTSNTINWKCLCRIHKPAGMHNIIKHYSLRAIRNRWQKQVIIFFFLNNNLLYPCASNSVMVAIATMSQQGNVKDFKTALKREPQMTNVESI